MPKHGLVQHSAPAGGAPLSRHYSAVMSDAAPSVQPDELLWALSPQAADAYVALLRGPLTDNGDAVEAIDELVANGFASIGYDDTVFAFPPAIAIARALANATTTWLRAAPDMDNAVRAARRHSVTPIDLRFDPKTRDGSEAQVLYESATAAAQRSIDTLQPYPHQFSERELEKPDQWSETPQDLLHRGVVVRSIYEETLLDIAAVRDLIDHETSHGAFARVTRDSLPTFMVIIDRRVAFVFAAGGGASTVTDEPGHVALLQAGFNAYWAASISMGDVTSQQGLDDDQRRVLALILAGRNNGAIARTLGVHERTVRRRTDELYTHYGVLNRHDLILRAAAAS
jgi:DNA-binding CsgD family transcriptional regulator